MPHTLRVTTVGGVILYDGNCYHRVEDRHSRRKMTHYVAIHLPDPVPAFRVVAWTVRVRPDGDDAEVIVSTVSPSK